MDALSLLCTLHAEGPASLRRLREAGYLTLDAVEMIEPERLADLLPARPEVAQRFRAEARSLRARLTETGLEPEETAPVEAPAATASSAPSAPARAPEPSAAPAPRVAGREATIEAVLRTWRVKDAADPVIPGEEEAEAEEAHGLLTPQPPPAPAPEHLPLAEVEIDGLDGATTERLGRARITNLEELLELDALEVGRRTGLAFTRVERLQFLAQRLLEELAPEELEEEEELEEIEDAEEEPFEDPGELEVGSAPPAPAAELLDPADELEAGGPFA